ncbi:MAG: DUF3124 domain-containing protein [Bryobacterales bacterium]
MPGKPVGGCDLPPGGQQALKPAGAQADALTVSGEAYVPIYSNVYRGALGRGDGDFGDLERAQRGRTKATVLTHVDYDDSRGELIRKYLDAPVLLDPMGTVEWMIDGTTPKAVPSELHRGLGGARADRAAGDGGDHAGRVAGDFVSEPGASGGGGGGAGDCLYAVGMQRRAT